MTYKAQLYPWCIIRPFPDMRVQVIGRFRNRSDAEGHLQILKRLMPNIPYQIMFDIPLEPPDSENSLQRREKLPSPIKRGSGRDVNPIESSYQEHF